jgi:hypothetical protein
MERNVKMKLNKMQLRALISEMVNLNNLTADEMRDQVTADVGVPKFDDESSDFDMTYDAPPAIPDNSKSQALLNALSDDDIVSSLVRLNNAGDQIASMIADDLYGDKASQEELLKSGMLQVAVSAALQRLSALLMTDEIEKL